MNRPSSDDVYYVQSVLRRCGYRVGSDPEPGQDRPQREEVVRGVQGLVLRTLRVHGDPRGSLHEAWRASWEGQVRNVPTEVRDSGVGLVTVWGGGPAGPIRQVYCSGTHPDVAKGWHTHAVQTDRFLVVRGRIVVALCDLRPMGDGSGPAGRPPQVLEVALSADLPRTLEIPPGVAHGWYNPGPGDALVVNLCSEEHDGGDEWRRPADAGPCDGVPYDWRRRRDG